MTGTKLVRKDDVSLRTGSERTGRDSNSGSTTDPSVEAKANPARPAGKDSRRDDKWGGSAPELDALSLGASRNELDRAAHRLKDALDRNPGAVPHAAEVFKLRNGFHDRGKH